MTVEQMQQRISELVQEKRRVEEVARNFHCFIEEYFKRNTLGIPTVGGHGEDLDNIFDGLNLENASQVARDLTDIMVSCSNIGGILSAR